MIDYKNHRFEEPITAKEFLIDCIYAACFVIIFFVVITIATMG